MQIRRVGLAKGRFSERVGAFFEGQVQGNEGVEHGLDVAVAEVLSRGFFEGLVPHLTSEAGSVVMTGVVKQGGVIRQVRLGARG